MIAGPSGQAEPRARASASARVITSAEAQEPLLAPPELLDPVRSLPVDGAVAASVPSGIVGYQFSFRQERFLFGLSDRRKAFAGWCMLAPSIDTEKDHRLIQKRTIEGPSIDTEKDHSI